MEYVLIDKDATEQGLVKGSKYSVARSTSGDCVVIVPNSMNVIMREEELRTYGRLVKDTQK